MEDWQRDLQRLSKDKGRKEVQELQAKYKAGEIEKIKKLDEKEILAEILFQLRLHRTMDEYQLNKLVKNSREWMQDPD
jgi:hypothetical protein